MIAQSLLARYLPIRGATFGLIATLIAWYAMRSGPTSGAFFGLIAGACEDALAGGTGAAWTFSSAAIGVLGGRLGSTLLVDSLWLWVPTIAALGIVRYAVFLLVMEIEGRTPHLVTLHLHQILLQALLDAALAFVALQRFPRLRIERVVDR